MSTNRHINEILLTKYAIISIKSQNKPNKTPAYSLYVEILTVMFTNSMFTKTNQLIFGIQFLKNTLNMRIINQIFRFMSIY